VQNDEVNPSEGAEEEGAMVRRPTCSIYRMVTRSCTTSVPSTANNKASRRAELRSKVMEEFRREEEEREARVDMSRLTEEEVSRW